MENKLENKIHSLSILNRERIEATTVQEVISSTDKEVIAKLEDNFLYITGTGLTIVKLIPSDCLLTVKGKIEGIKYVDKLNKKSFLGKVFK